MKQVLLVWFIILTTDAYVCAESTPCRTADTIAPHLIHLTDERTLSLLLNDPVFMEYWFNDMTFSYDSVRVTDLPDVTVIPINYPGEKFTPTWYGKLTSAYQWRWGRQHHGVDLGLKTGNPIYAAWDGIVRYAQWNSSGYGNCVVIRHKNGLETLYGHMSKLMVIPNQYVSSGDMIGLGGSTGRSTGPHLHFEIRYKDFSINPEHIIDFETLRVRVDTFQFFRSSISGSRYGGDINVGLLQAGEVESIEAFSHSIDSSVTTVYNFREDTLSSNVSKQTASITTSIEKETPAASSEAGITSTGSTNRARISSTKSPVKKHRKKPPTTY